MVLMAACSVRCGVLRESLVCRNWLALRVSGTVLPRNAVGVTLKIMYPARRGRLIPSRLRVPVPLAGKWIEKGTTRADARPRGEPNPSPGHPVSATVHGWSRLELGHSWCARLADVTPASRRMRLRSAKRGAG